MKTPILLTLTGPSGTGKSFLSNYLHNRGFEQLVSTTTRAPRAGEKNGQHYHFRTKEEFLRLKNDNAFIETITLGSKEKEDFYGVTAAEVSRAFELNKPAVVVAEPEGVRQIYRYCEEHGWKVVRVFINNPLDQLIDRILDRFHQDTQNLDISDPQDLISYNKRKASHGSRIERVSRFEQDNWVTPARTGKDSYELFFENFGPEFEHDVLQQIDTYVNQILEEYNSPNSESQKKNITTNEVKSLPPTLNRKVTL